MLCRSFPTGITLSQKSNTRKADSDPPRLRVDARLELSLCAPIGHSQFQNVFRKKPADSLTIADKPAPSRRGTDPNLQTLL